MAYFTIQEAREAFERRQRGRTVRKTASQVLNEEVASVRDTDRFDIFLSHCVRDAGVKLLLEEQRHKVYVDWLVDKQLDRGRVTPETADIIRGRMKASESLLFATSESSPDPSGCRGNSAILTDCGKGGSPSCRWLRPAEARSADRNISAYIR